MSYETREGANYGENPILLIMFQRGTKIWYYNNQDEDLDAGGKTWLGKDIPISMDGNRQSGDATQDSVTFTVPSSLPVATLFTNLATSGGILCRVQRTFAADMNDLRQYWSGLITSRRMVNPASYQLIGQLISYSGSTQGVRLREGRGCTFQLYQQFNTCMVKKEDYAHTSRILTMDGASVTAETMPSGKSYSAAYTGGFVTFEYEEGIVEQRGILLQEGSKLTLLGGTAGITPTTVLTINPGCPRDWDSCGTLYGNQDNYGGDPVFPGVSPFTSAIFQPGG